MIPAPNATPCVSHWQATNRGPSSLYGYNANPSTRVPERADVVVVGGGTMGASLAYFLGKEGGGKKVVVLEARDVASGANGRNGPIGQGGSGGSSAESVRIVQSEIENLDVIAEVIASEGFDVDFWRGELCEVYESKRSSEAHKEGYEAWTAARKDHGIPGRHHTTFINDAAEAQTISRFAHAHSCQLRPAASVHSHKLCTELFRAAITSPDGNCKLYTHAPVQSMERSDDGLWSV